MEKQNHRDSGTRRLPGPADCRLGEGRHSGGSLRIVSGLAENTNSIIGDGSPEPETANGCPVLQGRRDHQPRGTRAQRRTPDRCNARSPERAQRTRAFRLTVTYMDVGNSECMVRRRIASEKMRKAEMVCANVSGLGWSSDLLA